MLTSIIVPTYNEIGNILILIKRILTVYSGKKGNFEIIIVDDNSPDKTVPAIRKKFGKYNNIRSFIRKKERGLASAIFYGIRQSQGDIIIGMDADFNHPPELIPGLLRNLIKSDVVIASRFINGGGMDDKVRYFFTYIFNLFLKYFLNFPTMDNMSGFYAIHRLQLLKLPIEKIYQGYGEYHLRLVYLAKKKGLRIKEIPVYYKKRAHGQSKSNLFRMFFQYLKIAISLRLTDGRI